MKAPAKFFVGARCRKRTFGQEWPERSSSIWSFLWVCQLSSGFHTGGCWQITSNTYDDEEKCCFQKDFWNWPSFSTNHASPSPSSVLSMPTNEVSLKSYEYVASDDFQWYYILNRTGREDKIILLLSKLNKNRWQWSREVGSACANHKREKFSSSWFLCPKFHEMDEKTFIQHSFVFK